MKQSDATELDARADVFTRIFFGVLFSLPLVGSFFTADATVRLIGGIFSGAIFLLGLIFFHNYRILFDGEVISYRGALGRTRSIGLDRVTSAWTEIGRERRTDPMYRLVIEVDDESPMVINMKPFKKQDLDQLFTILGSKMVSVPRVQIFGKEKS